MTGQAKVTIVDPSDEGITRISDAVGWGCDHQPMTIKAWVEGGGLKLAN